MRTGRADLIQGDNEIERSLRRLVETTRPPAHVISLLGGRMRIGEVGWVLGKSQAPAGEQGEAAAIGNAIHRGGAGLRLRT